MKKDLRSEFWSNLLIVSLKIFLFFFLLTLPVSTILRSWQRCQKYLPLQKIAIYFLMCSTLIQLYFCCKWHHKTLREDEGKVFYFSAWSFLQNVSFFFFFLENPVCLELKMSIEEALLPAGCQTRKLDVVLTLPLSYATSLKLRYLASLFNIVSKNLELGKFWILPLFSTCLWFQHIYCDCKYGQCYHFHLQKYCHAKTSSWVS